MEVFSLVVQYTKRLSSFVQALHRTSGQSYNTSTIVFYKSRVLTISNTLVSMTLEWQFMLVQALEDWQLDSNLQRLDYESWQNGPI